MRKLSYALHMEFANIDKRIETQSMTLTEQQLQQQSMPFYII